MSTSTVEYVIPASWAPRDVVDWMNATLDEPGVTSIEVLRHPEGWLARVHSAE